jgi:hypothetical protein
MVFEQVESLFVGALEAIPKLVFDAGLPLLVVRHARIPSGRDESRYIF